MVRDLPILTVVTSEYSFEKEAYWINTLLSHGMECLWLRKHIADIASVNRLLERIDASFFNKILLSYPLWTTFSEKNLFYGVHFSEKNRVAITDEKLKELKGNGIVVSTSVHSQDTYLGLSADFDQTFVSPLFDSISKENYQANQKAWSIGQQQKHIATIGLGGITTKNVWQVLDSGFDGAAVLGNIWKADNPLQQWIDLKDAIQL